jgi:DNA helicase II / ATP-dependent DNA helicase PcrA
MPPNPRQQEAISGTGIQLIIAGPGSGKTRVIIEKIQYLIRQGVPPSAILALTFSEKAAQEMESRLEQVMDIADLTVQTFHSFCLDVLKDNVLETGLNFSSGLISRANQLVWGLRNIDSFGFAHIEVGNNASGVIESIIDGISAFRDELITPEELRTFLSAKEDEVLPVDERGYLGQLADLLTVYAAYERYKRSEMLLDYDDMITEAVRLFTEKPHILQRYKERFRYILVDEFQDTNYAQFTLVKLLCGDHLCAVGDDDQTIYRFRGAYFGNFQDFRQSFDPYQETLLDQNYRNSQKILTLALQLMMRTPNRNEKPLFTGNSPGEDVVVAECEDEQTEALFVLQEIQRLQKISFFSRRDGQERLFAPRDIAILCRRRTEGIKFHRTLRQHGIPCEFVGEVDFFGMPVVRDMLAYLKAIQNPIENGIALNRILRGAGVPETVVQTINLAARTRARKGSSGDGVFLAMQAGDGIEARYLPQVQEIVAHLEDLMSRKHTLTLPETVFEVMMRSTGIYRTALADETGQQRLVLHQLYAIAQEYDAITREPGIADFLEYVDLLSRFSLEVEENEEGDAVQILTIHRSKGKEFPVVFIADLAQRKFPLDFRRKPFSVPRALARGLTAGEDERALYLQEERRLCYVAMTRAEERLYLTRSRWYGENQQESRPSAFLSEIAYQSNPIIRVVQVPAEQAVFSVETRGPLDRYRSSLQEQIVHAVSEMRTKAALQHLLELEKVRLAAEGSDAGAFDRAQFLNVPESESNLALLIHGQRVPLITDAHTFSASSLQAYEQCPLKYKFAHVLSVPSLPKPFFSLGSAVHEVIEHLSKDRMRGIALDRDRALQYLDSFWQPDGFSSQTQERERRRQAEQMLGTYLLWEAENQNRILEVEHGFRFVFFDRIMKGYIDRVEQTPAGRYIVLDYKTGAKPSDLTKKSLPQNIQLNFYSLAIQETFGVLPERASLYYIKEKTIVDYRPTVDSIAGFKEYLTSLIGQICAEQFPARPSYSGCRWCDYASLCEGKER